MTEKQKRFADEYLKDLNATRAYRAVYKNCRTDETAAVAASRMLRNVKVEKYIKEQTEALHTAKIADVREVMEFLTRVLRGEDVECAVVGEESINVQPAVKDRIKAAELIGKRYGMFTDKIDIDGTAKVVFIDDLKE